MSLFPCYIQSPSCQDLPSLPSRRAVSICGVADSEYELSLPAVKDTTDVEQHEHQKILWYERTAPRALSTDVRVSRDLGPLVDMLRGLDG